jgi:hypothetical protein
MGAIMRSRHHLLNCEPDLATWLRCVLRHTRWDLRPCSERLEGPILELAGIGGRADLDNKKVAS